MLSVSPNVHYSQETISRMYSGGIHQINRDLADIESLSTLLHNKVIQSRDDLNSCFYFLRLNSSENLRIDHFSLSLRIADSIRKLTNQTSAKGLIYGNSLVGRQIFSASPNDFIGFIDRKPEKPCLPGVAVFGLGNIPPDYQFVICSVSLDVKTKTFLANYFKGLGKGFYSLEEFYGL
jgi:hypothetical protein